MKKKHMMAVLAAAMVVGASSSCFAAANPFSDVPQGHWAYDAVSQLAKDGVIEGYGDTTFQGNKNITRYEMAQMVAKAMAKTNVPSNDKALIDKLSAEFGDELSNLGVRVAKLEKKSDNFKWSGAFMQKYERVYHKGPQHNVSPWYEKEFDLNASATIPGTGWKASLGIVTKWGSGKGNGFNDEHNMPDTWNGGDSRSNENRIDTMWVEGPLGKTGQYAKLGDYRSWTMNGFVNDANIKGASLEHYGSNYATHLMAGRLDVKDWDMAVNGAWGPDWNGVGPANDYGDNVRYHDLQADRTERYSGGCDNFIDWSDWSMKRTTKDIYGFVYDHTFNRKFNGSVGYYLFRSAAYNHSWLSIYSGLFNYKLAKNLNLEGMYAHGNRGGHDNAWNVELQFRGNPWIPSGSAKLFGAYLGYRVLAPDALIKSNFGDGIEKGQRGWEIGFFYNIMKNCQFQFKYGNGKSITAPNHRDRSKIHTAIEWDF